jgi:diguanylate cyclase (GGDEF)-like protein
MTTTSSWSTQQLAEFLVAVSAFGDEPSAIRGAMEHAAEAVEAEIAAFVRDDEVFAAGFPDGQVPHAALRAAAEAKPDQLEIPGRGPSPLAVIELEEEPQGRLLLARAGEPFDYEELNLLRAMGRALNLNISMLRLLERERALRAASEREVAERRQAERQLEHQALHDSLTGLPNRTLLLDRLGHALAVSSRHGSKVAVFFADLDNFKVINDDLGHTVGDQLLVAVADRLQKAVRRSDTVGRHSTNTVARLGGDEFVVLCEGLTSERDAIRVAERMTEVLRSPFEFSETVFVTASVGIAPASAGATPESLIRDADAAMYMAKERGRDRYEIFDEVMRSRVLGRLHAENELRKAIDADELRLFYQPIVSLSDGRWRGAEALIRWEHPERGLLPPSEFIPLAEESGLILPLGQWVLHEACRQAGRWEAEHQQASELTVTINVAARQLADPGLLDAISTAIDETGIDATRLGIEITESSLLEETTAPVEFLEAIKALGVRLILDDFGTGYSSLSYLQRLPLDMLKLDRSFVTPLGAAPEEWKLVAAVIDMAAALGISMVAEGVETREQQQRLAALGARLAQGYYFAKPMPAEAFSALLAQQPDWHRSVDPANGSTTAKATLDR